MINDKKTLENILSVLISCNEKHPDPSTKNAIDELTVFINSFEKTESLSKPWKDSIIKMIIEIFARLGIKEMIDHLPD